MGVETSDDDIEVRGEVKIVHLLVAFADGVLGIGSSAVDVASLSLYTLLYFALSSSSSCFLSFIYLKFGLFLRLGLLDLVF